MDDILCTAHDVTEANRMAQISKIEPVVSNSIKNDIPFQI